MEGTRFLAADVAFVKMVSVRQNTTIWSLKLTVVNFMKMAYCDADEDRKNCIGKTNTSPRSQYIPRECHVCSTFKKLSTLEKTEGTQTETETNTINVILQGKQVNHRVTKIASYACLFTIRSLCLSFIPLPLEFCTKVSPAKFSKTISVGVVLLSRKPLNQKGYQRDEKSFTEPNKFFRHCSCGKPVTFERGTAGECAIPMGALEGISEAN